MPKKVDHELRRKDLAKAAFRVIARRGLTAATIREVAKEAGYSHGAIRHYIKSKDQLLLEAANYATTLTRARLKVIEQNYSGVEAIRQTFWELLPLSTDRAQHMRVWFSFWERSLDNADVRRVIEEFHLGTQRALARLIRRAQLTGEIPTDVHVSSTAGLAVALLGGLSVEVFMGGEKLIPPRTQRDYARRWIEIHLRPRA